MVGCADLEAPTSHKRRLQAFTADDRRGAPAYPPSPTTSGRRCHGRPDGLPVKFVFSHDSIGVGKNGPTHQPVEILAPSLRAMPNMLVMRPADAVEAAECWEAALEHRDGPVTMVFARQALPTVRRQHVAEPVATRRLRAGRSQGGARAVTLLLRPGPKSHSRSRRAPPTACRQHSDRGYLDAVLGTLRSAG